MHSSRTEPVLGVRGLSACFAGSEPGSSLRHRLVTSMPGLLCCPGQRTEEPQTRCVTLHTACVKGSNRGLRRVSKIGPTRSGLLGKPCPCLRMLGHGVGLMTLEGQKPLERSLPCRQEAFGPRRGPTRKAESWLSAGWVLMRTRGQSPCVGDKVRPRGLQRRPLADGGWVTSGAQVSSLGPCVRRLDQITEGFLFLF